MIGTTVSHYRIVDKLGEGGMGIVYRAQDTRLGRDVALKFLPGDHPAAPAIRERFLQEARAASALAHPNVAVVYDVGEDGHRSYIAMELVEGETLRTRLTRGPLPIDQVQAIGSQLAEGLRAAHAKGIVHRDIKPDNLLLTADDIVKITDFGIARLGDSNLTETGMLLGTLAYMAPEQILGQPIDQRTDLWSCGVVLYEMLAGRPPFQREGSAAVMYEVLNAEPPPVEQLRPDTPAPLGDLLRALLQKDPARRLDSAAGMIAALRGTAAPAPEEPRARSIAVLYFENLSPDPESDYICAGITEDILTDLAKLDGLQVIPRADVLPFRGKEVNTRQVASALRVNYVLEGSVRKAGSRIRISAQLVDARDGYQVWADRFDGLVDDIFDLQAEVARLVAESLKLSLTDSDQETLARKPTDDLRAYDFFLRGREFLNRRGKANTEAAIRMFEAALEIDPDFVGAFAGLGEACAYMYEWYDGGSAWLSRAIEMDREALERAPDSVDARFGVAMVYVHQERVADARRALEEILTADPDHLRARLRLGALAERSGTPDGLQEALSHYRAATDRHPHDDEAWRALATVHQKLGDQAAAEEVALQVVELTASKLEASLEDVVLLSRLGEAYALLSAREEAVATIQRVVELAPDDGLALYHAARGYALLSQVDESIRLLRRACDSGFRGVARAVRSDAAFDILRVRPDLDRLLTELREKR